MKKNILAYKIISAISLLIALIFYILLVKEVVMSYTSVFELSFEAMMLTIVLTTLSFFSYKILLNKLHGNFIIATVQILTILYCLDLVYYYNFSDAPIIYDEIIQE